MMSEYFSAREYQNLNPRVSCLINLITVGFSTASDEQQLARNVKQPSVFIMHIPGEFSVLSAKHCVNASASGEAARITHEIRPAIIFHSEKVTNAKHGMQCLWHVRLVGPSQQLKQIVHIEHRINWPEANQFDYLEEAYSGTLSRRNLRRLWAI